MLFKFSKYFESLESFELNIEREAICFANIGDKRVTKILQGRGELSRKGHIIEVKQQELTRSSESDFFVAYGNKFTG